MSDQSKGISGTLISHPANGYLYFSPHHYRDGAAAFRERREDFSMPDAELLSQIVRRLMAEGSGTPKSAGEYVELGGVDEAA